MEQSIKTYQNAVDVIKTAILQSQARAVKAVNQEQLALYYGIGRYVSANTRKKNWGKGTIEAISSQLSKELPGLRGFSARNIKNMRTFFEGWHLLEQNNSAVATAEFTRINKNESVTSSNVNSAVVTAEIPVESEIRQLQLANLPDLKREDFKVAYLEEAPIGIILCKNADKAYMEYIMQDFRQPMGVATYKTADEMDPELLKILPPKEELQKVFEESTKKEEEV